MFFYITFMPLGSESPRIYTPSSVRLARAADLVLQPTPHRWHGGLGSAAHMPANPVLALIPFSAAKRRHGDVASESSQEDAHGGHTRKENDEQSEVPVALGQLLRDVRKIGCLLYTSDAADE